MMNSLQVIQVPRDESNESRIWDLVSGIRDREGWKLKSGSWKPATGNFTPAQGITVVTAGN
jgi:hypothetical protein